MHRSTAAGSYADRRAIIVPAEFICSTQLRQWPVHILYCRGGTGDATLPFVLALLDTVRRVDAPGSSHTTENKLLNITTGMTVLRSVTLPSDEDLEFIQQHTHSQAFAPIAALLPQMMDAHERARLSRVLPALVGFMPLVAPLTGCDGSYQESILVTPAQQPVGSGFRTVPSLSGAGPAACVYFPIDMGHAELDEFHTLGERLMAAA